MPLVESFDPVIGTDPKILILGSMPGVASLQAQQYYAHPRNTFWPIMSEIFEVEWAESYDARIAQFTRLPLALWDVLGSCHREGSLDADIRPDRLRANPIENLLDRFPGIFVIAFNGATAEKYFHQRIKSRIKEFARLELIRLPSTSPAHAALSRQKKLDAWRALTRYLN